MSTKVIKLTRGKQTIVDAEDYERLSQYKWQAVPYTNGTRTIWYAQRAAVIDGKRTTRQMQKDIIECPKGMKIDHRNGNGLDNQKSNLRVSTNSQNQANSGPTCRNKTGYKGVSFHKKIKKFSAYINVNGESRFLGWHDTAEQAHLAYKAAAIQVHGEFARTEHF